MNESTADFVARVKLNMEAARKRTHVKEKPLRITKTEAGKVILVEWLCPACSGKPGWKGCTTCKGCGVIDGIAKAIYNELHCIG